MKNAVLPTLCLLLLYSFSACAGAAAQTDITESVTDALPQSMMPAVVTEAAPDSVENPDSITDTDAVPDSDVVTSTPTDTQPLQTTGEPPSYDVLAAVIEENMEILLSDSSLGYRDEREIIAAHPDAFAAITALGSDALPYLTAQDFTLSVQYDAILRGALYRYAAYTISPALYDLSFTAPDNACTLTFSDCTFSNVYGNRPQYRSLTAVCGQTRYEIAPLTGSIDAPERVCVTWSPAVNSVVLELWCDRVSDFYLLNLQNGDFLALYDTLNIHAWVKDDLPDVLQNDTPWFYAPIGSAEYLDDDTLRLHFCVLYDAAGQMLLTVSGSADYRLSEITCTNVDYRLIPQGQEES